MMTTVKARILSIDKFGVCSSKVIWAELKDENKNIVHRIKWGKTPIIDGISGIWCSRASSAFNKVWRKSKEGDEVLLYHSKDPDFSYFEPLEEEPS